MLLVGAHLRENIYVFLWSVTLFTSNNARSRNMGPQAYVKPPPRPGGTGVLPPALILLTLQKLRKVDVYIKYRLHVSNSILHSDIFYWHAVYYVHKCDKFRQRHAHNTCRPVAQRKRKAYLMNISQMFDYSYSCSSDKQPSSGTKTGFHLGDMTETPKAVESGSGPKGVVPLIRKFLTFPWKWYSFDAYSWTVKQLKFKSIWPALYTYWRRMKFSQP